MTSNDEKILFGDQPQKNPQTIVGKRTRTLSGQHDKDLKAIAMGQDAINANSKANSSKPAAGTINQKVASAA